jgi:ribosome-binding factor A
MPDEIRLKRIEAFFLQELSRIVSRELRNPIFEGKLICFLSTKVSRDLSIAHVAVSVLGDSKSSNEVIEALNKAEPVIRRELMKVSDLRRVPKMVFHEDRTMENAARIDSLLDSLDIPPAEPEVPSEPDDPSGEKSE